MSCDYAEQRFRMVRDQIRGRGLYNQRILEVFQLVPRHLFVPADQQDLAYTDQPLSIGWGQTISQPYIVALMTSLLELRGGEKVLEIGTGSGYQAAILSRLAKTVHTIEYLPVLAARAEKILQTLEYDNITIHSGDGSQGWPEAAPYDSILITAASPEPSPVLLNQLAEGGRLVAPVGSPNYQELQVWQRRAGEHTHEGILPVSFVPLRGKFGWDVATWPPRE